MVAYVIAEIAVVDTEVYEQYKPLAAASIAAHNGVYRARGGTVEPLEGEAPAGRVVVLEFPSLQAANDWYHSEEYKPVMPLRHASAESRVFIVEGTSP
jgi:uncharacterized protein (DUF1330 family)